MVKSKTQYVCQQCGASYSKWAGRCENCGEWNTLVEQLAAAGQSSVDKAGASGKKLTVQSLVGASKEQSTRRLSTSVEDLDIVLGGGIIEKNID